MSTVVTLNVFSGRPNPTWLLTPAQEKELEGRLDAAQSYTHQRPTGILGSLGFRGFSVSRDRFSSRGPLDLFVHEGIFDRGTQAANLVDQTEAEKWLLTTAGGAVDDEVKSHVASTLSAPPARMQAFATTTGGVACPPCHAADAPLYQPQLWNIPSVQPHNNCYNYANNQITNTFAQPGRAHGHQAKALQCRDVQAAAQADGLTPASNFSAQLAAGQGWYVALVIWPDKDYHWYRQDKVGCWSHKPGQTAARDVDNAGHKIADPRSCDRGPYRDFCTYMVTKRGLVIR